jgi:hypothetical protein
MVLLSNNYGRSHLGVDLISHVLISIFLFSVIAIRGQAVALSVQMNFLFNAIVQFGVPVLENWVGLNLTFAIFAVFTAYR